MYPDILRWSFENTVHLLSCVSVHQGTMSGGGKSVSRGRMGSAVVGDGHADPKQLANLENELEKVSDQLFFLLLLLLCRSLRQELR